MGVLSVQNIVYNRVATELTGSLAALGEPAAVLAMAPDDAIKAILAQHADWVAKLKGNEEKALTYAERLAGVDRFLLLAKIKKRDAALADALAKNQRWWQHFAGGLKALIEEAAKHEREAGA